MMNATQDNRRVEKHISFLQLLTINKLGGGFKKKNYNWTCLFVFSVIERFC